MYNRGGPPGRPGYGGDRPPSYVASEDYLKAGYFDAKGNPRPELITAEADKVADELYRSRVGYSQARKFFSKARFIQQQLESGQPFDTLVWRIVALDRDAADAVGRGSAPRELKQFIEKNVLLARRGEREFAKGFMQHFESVMAYFRYRRPSE